MLTLAAAAACGEATTPAIGIERPVDSTRTADVDVGWIERLPRIDFVPGSAAPTREGWPADGAAVIWRAHVLNRGAAALRGVEYEWRVADTVVARGTLDLLPHSETEADLPARWSFVRDDIRFTIDPRGLLGDTPTENNSLVVQSDALTVAFYVEQGMYEYFLRHQPDLRIGSASFEDWANRQTRIWNDLARRALSDLAPRGVLDRFRVDRIVVVPNGSIVGFTKPNPNDRSVDLQWGVTNHLNTGDGPFNDYRFTSVADLSIPFYYDGVILHELGHARYLVDVYRFDVNHGAAGGWVDIREGDALVAGSAFMPLSGTKAYAVPVKGLMNSTYTQIDDYSAVALNLIHGERALFGNANPAPNMGSYLEDLPVHNIFAPVDELGRSLPGAVVRLFFPRDSLGFAAFYSKVADVERITDSAGAVDLGADPFHIRVSDGRFPAGSRQPQTAIVRVQTGARVGYGFLPLYLLNRAFWLGSRDSARYEIPIRLR